MTYCRLAWRFGMLSRAFWWLCCDLHLRLASTYYVCDFNDLCSVRLIYICKLSSQYYGPVVRQKSSCTASGRLCTVRTLLDGIKTLKQEPFVQKLLRMGCYVWECYNPGRSGILSLGLRYIPKPAQYLHQTLALTQVAKNTAVPS